MFNFFSGSSLERNKEVKRARAGVVLIKFIFLIAYYWIVKVYSLY
jgi:hypothetical protein